jgi:hypothetical protein
LELEKNKNTLYLTNFQKYFTGKFPHVAPWIDIAETDAATYTTVHFITLATAIFPNSNNVVILTTTDAAVEDGALTTAPVVELQVKLFILTLEKMALPLPPGNE